MLRIEEGTYKRAEALLPWNLGLNVFNTWIFPYWSRGRFFYFRNTSEGSVLIEVDSTTGGSKSLFQINKLLLELSSKLGRIIEEKDINFSLFQFKEEIQQLKFIFSGYCWFIDLHGVVVSYEVETEGDCLKSPDSTHQLTVKDYNLFLHSNSNQVTQLTYDGDCDNGYAISPETNTRTISDKLAQNKQVPVAVWSPNSKKFITHRLDQKHVKQLHLLQNAPPGMQRPVMHSYRMSFSGDDILPRAELLIVDAFTKKITPIKFAALLSPYLTPIEFEWIWWSKNGDRVYFLSESRGSKALLLCVADTETGNVNVLIEEQAETFVEPSSRFRWRRQVSVIESSNQILWLSERQGYPHLYCYKTGGNEPEHVVTSGEWCVRELHFYDEKSDWVYFTATGYFKDVDPYYRQLFRCHIDGTSMTCLTFEPMDHIVQFSPAHDCFIDTYSTISEAPKSVLRSVDGAIIAVLEIANIDYLKKKNWVPPKRFCEKGRDGKTLMYGNLYFPSNFDPAEKYPLIDHIYPGPQVYRTVPGFSLYTAIFRSPWVAQALAELGFIVMQMDGMGTPGRSSGFHRMTYGSMGDCGLPDHAAVIHQLIKKYEYIDGEKIGITGYSGGGYATARGMFMFPELFKVGVAAAGNHDLRCYPASYGEKYNGLNHQLYEEQSSASLAKALQGKLLLIHGEMDDNVHPCATMQLVEELIKWNKDFDMLIMPNQNHRSTFDHPYYWRKHWDYLVKNLLGIEPPVNYQFGEIMPTSFFQIFDW